MRNTKIKGFSLAEVMIAMLVISVALAAAIPTITKRTAGTDNIWRAGDVNSDGSPNSEVLAFTGPNLMLGSIRLPLLSGLSHYFSDGTMPVDDFKFIPRNDKLVLFKTINDDEERFKSSHIGFYNKEDGSPKYAGRLTSDKYNLALGIGSLQILQPNYSVADNPVGAYNTAIGHYALFGNKDGSYNTALGYNALKGDGIRSVNNNIALGDSALLNVRGDNNIAIGSHAGSTLQGDNNIVIGAGAGSNLRDTKKPINGDSSNNILITTMNAFDPVAHKIEEGNYQTKILLSADGDPENNYPRITDDDNFAIGILNRWKTNSNPIPPIMQGFTKTAKGNGTGCVDGICHAKGLIINADQFNVNTNDGTPIFSVLNNATPITMFNLPSAPCNGAPICLAKFKIRSASFYSKNTWSGIANNDYIHREDQPILYGPGFVEDSSANVLIPQGRDTYDLFIGSTTSNYVDFKKSSSTFGSRNTLNAEVVTSDTSSGKILVESGDTENLIDVGQRRHSAGLNYSQQSESQFSVQKALNTPASHYSLQIRTVKTAVNFLDDFKENADPIYKWRNKMDDIIKCFFGAFLDNKILDGSKKSCLNTQTNSDEEAQEYPTLIAALICRSHSDWDICDPSSPFCRFFKKAATCKSDARLKNISGDNTDGLDEINKLKVYNYTYKADKSKTPHVGVIAQDLKKVFPNAVTKGSDGYYRIRLEDMFYAMINSVKELSEKKDAINKLTVDYIDSPLAELKQQNADIKAQNELIKQKNAEIEKRLSRFEIK